MSISLIQLVADTLGVDPETTPLYLEDYVCLDYVDMFANQPDHEDGENNCMSGYCAYGEYVIFACSCGEMAIYGNLREHKRGSLDAPCFDD